jgi:hypothetical protein
VIKALQVSLSAAKVDIFRNIFKVCVDSEKSSITVTLENFPASGSFAKIKTINEL